MPVSDNKKLPPVSSTNGAEVRFQARSVSRGVAIGEVVSLHGNKRQFYKINLEDSQIEREIRRFYASIRLAKRQLKKITEKKRENLPELQSSIFETHILMLEDAAFLKKIESVIKEKKVNAEWAVKSVTQTYTAQYKTIADEYLRERYIDLEDVAERILSALGGGKSSISLKKDSIIVAKEVKPSTLVELVESSPKAIVSEHGGWTSHTFILAREMNLPAVTGSTGILRRVRTGDRIIVDGFNGQVILRPSAETMRDYRLAAAQFQQTNEQIIEFADGDVKTLDGREIIIRSNLDLPDGYEQAKKLGARGIGLYRSEFLFNQYKGFPTEHEQTKAYREIAEMVGEDGVKIRTFDLSAEHFADKAAEKEKNPALGMRAIRLSLTNKKQFRTQLSAVLQASANGRKIDLILPMISDVSEIMQTKKILEAEKTSLRRKKTAYGNPLIGAMIEVPSAVFTIDEIAAEVDFLCLGTNDLVQYLLAVDRDNENIAEWFQTLHPSVIRAIKKVLDAAENRGIPAIVCGEMAGSPFYAPILIGLGARQLSMNVNSIARVRKVISGIAFEETLELVRMIENCKSAAEIETLVRKNIREKWAHLFPFEQ
ncbi:MAG TPA: phosphoenolpyruvate--protein phosphotransferase [Pyrinomonadaceae bacterium]|jgi:phosphotransferase system enzyme I (PtsI)